MKKTLLFILLFVRIGTANAQFGYIETDDKIVLKAGDIVSYDTPDIYCDAKYSTAQEIWIVTIMIQDPATLEFRAAMDLEFTKATIDALTTSESTNTEKIQNCILQAVAASLGAINPGTTFTIN